MSSITAFYSYAHIDDDNTDGFVTGLAKAFRKEYQLLSGEELALFVDRDEESGLRWGVEWRRTVDNNVANASFFIPVLSPAYLMRPECRREFEEFQRAAHAGQQDRLIMPVLLVQLPADALKDDPIAMRASALQWVDWSELRMASPLDPEYRRLVNRMARRLLEVQRDLDVAAERVNADSVSEPSPQYVTGEHESEDSAGELDQFALAEQKVVSLEGLLQKMTSSMVDVQATMEAAVPDISKATSFAQKLIRVTKLSQDLAPLCDEYFRLAKEYVGAINEADAGVRGLLRRTRALLTDHAASGEGMAPDQAGQFVGSVSEFASASLSVLKTAEETSKKIATLEGMARAMRPPVRTIRAANAMLISTRPVFEGWLSPAAGE